METLGKYLRSLLFIQILLYISAIISIANNRSPENMSEAFSGVFQLGLFILLGIVNLALLTVYIIKANATKTKYDPNIVKLVAIVSLCVILYLPLLSIIR